MLKSDISLVLGRIVGYSASTLRSPGPASVSMSRGWPGIAALAFTGRHKRKEISIKILES